MEKQAIRKLKGYPQKEENTNMWAFLLGQQERNKAKQIIQLIILGPERLRYFKDDVIQMTIKLQ